MRWKWTRSVGARPNRSRSWSDASSTSSCTLARRLEWYGQNCNYLGKPSDIVVHILNFRNTLLLSVVSAWKKQKNSATPAFSLFIDVVCCLVPVWGNSARCNSLSALVIKSHFQPGQTSLESNLEKLVTLLEGELEKIGQRIIEVGIFIKHFIINYFIEVGVRIVTPRILALWAICET